MSAYKICFGTRCQGSGRVMERVWVRARIVKLRRLRSCERTASGIPGRANGWPHNAASIFTAALVSTDTGLLGADGRTMRWLQSRRHVG